ncbi:MAG: aminotransferase class V-fold PLP-dependent enzyme [Reichenbachiella sp.]|uniref:aminotransferase class V-fold PLP-dependent enzyme n=1 Tax=Reichenbachiella sp. TaxID=2184521 RepID=UPI003263BFBA
MQQTTNWEQIRAKYQLANQRIYFNTPSFGAMSDQTAKVQKDCIDLLQTRGNQLNERAAEASKVVRQLMHEMTNAQHHEIAIIPDVSTAMNHLAEMLSEKKKVALLKSDYPATSAPWMLRGFDIEWIERNELGYEIEDIEQAIINGAEVLVLSWVMYNTGALLDLRAIGTLCRKYDVVFIVDATQGLAANPLDLTEVHLDVLLASAFKWMVAGYGIALAIASHEFTSRYEVIAAGQNTMISAEKEANDLSNYRAGIERFELGHAKIQQVLALENALLELKAIGFSNILQRTAQLGNLLREKLLANGVEIMSPNPASANILMIEATDDRIEKLKNADVEFTHRHGLIRLGAYFYNDEGDINYLIDQLL